MYLTSNSASPSEARCGSGLTFPDVNTGAINPAADLAAVLKNTGATPPQVSSGDAVAITPHQVNVDGAGPMKCSIDAPAQGIRTVPLPITRSFPLSFLFNHVDNPHRATLGPRYSALLPLDPQPLGSLDRPRRS